MDALRSTFDGFWLASDDDDIRAMLSQRQRDGTAYALACARDDGYAICQVESRHIAPVGCPSLR